MQEIHQLLLPYEQEPDIFHDNKSNPETFMKTFFISLFIISFLGCDRLNEKTAAELASAIANKECLKLYTKELFSPDSYKAVFAEGKWSWGKIDPAGINGYSADVSFDMNGNNQKVTICFSTDINNTDMNSKPEIERMQKELDQH
ncbi:MAG: hypothetical protein JW913_04835 [Chitinispirillaceae bacterium]|nr:hypothetical protein [Chitinispirillaceae bacterium]